MAIEKEILLLSGVIAKYWTIEHWEKFSRFKAKKATVILRGFIDEKAYLTGLAQVASRRIILNGENYPYKEKCNVHAVTYEMIVKEAEFIDAKHLI